MNAACKLIAFVGQSAGRALSIVAQREPTTGDLIAARRILIGMRADLDEADTRIRAEISRRVQRPNPLVPDHAAITDRDVDSYKQRLETSLGGPADGAEDVVLDSIACDRAVDTPTAPKAHLPRGRYTWDHHARRLIAAGGSLQLTQRRA